jgi:beta-lactamase class A
MKKFLGASFTKKNVYIISVILLVIASLVAGYFIGLITQKDKYADFLRSFIDIRENSDKDTFINPLIGGLSAPATDVGIYSDIKDEIVSYLDDEKVKGNLYDDSFYFRDMGTGLWFGINESATFFPASLFKLPVAIAVYKEIETDPTLLKKSLVYSADISNKNSDVQLNSQSILIIGKAYTIEDLVQIMLVQSDNGAKDLLLTALDVKYLDQLFAIVSLVDPRSVKTYEVSSRKYAYFLRILYGSSYINEEHSELVLKYLSQSTFRDGLVSGLPEGTLVAHKYGAYEFQETIDRQSILTQQLHDCGIVYHSQKSYIFCLMTKGKDTQNLYRIISHVSKLVYDNQEQNQKEDNSWHSQ